MNVSIRPFEPSEARVLREIFFRSIHELTVAEYDAAQREAWAPSEYEESEWSARLIAIQPFVARVNADVAGYADVQASGYIDHFFVSPSYARCGVGSALMGAIFERASEEGARELFSDVSLTAEPFFAKYGFFVEKRNSLRVRGVELVNATMRKVL